MYVYLFKESQKLSDTLKKNVCMYFDFVLSIYVIKA